MALQQITYKSVDGTTLRLHVSPPSESVGAVAPTAVFYHGGGWVKGSWTQFRPQAAHLNALGILAVLVEYRLGGPVAATADATDAMTAVFEKARDIGCDTSRIIAIGGSAGGQLALATAVLEPPYANPGHRPTALVLLNPVTNTCGEFPIGFGRRHFDNDSHAKRYSPLHHITGSVPPTLIMHGTADTAVHHENSVEFVKAVKGYGCHAEIVLYPGQAHGFFNPRSATLDRPGIDGDKYFDQTTQEMARFILRRWSESGAAITEP